MRPNRGGVGAKNGIGKKRTPLNISEVLTLVAERQGYEPTPSYLSNSMRYQYVKALGGTT